MTVIADTIANNPNLEFEDSAYSEIHASDRSANAALIHTYLRCVKLDDPGLVENACYTAYSSDFSQLGSLNRLNHRELEVGARLSPSKQKSVTVDYDRIRREDDDLIHIEIWNAATGDRETLLEMKADTTFGTNRQGAPAVEWGHDDGLIYSNAASNPPTVFIAEPGSYEITRTIKLPSRFQGIVEKLFLSPDGTRLLLEYERHGYNAGRFPIVLDLQSLEVTMPVRQAYDSVPFGDEGSSSIIRALGWSPDSNWILVGHHIPLSTDAQTLLSRRYDLSAVPASSEYAAISGDESEVSPGVVPLKFYDPDEAGRLSTVDGEYQYVWLP